MSELSDGQKFVLVGDGWRSWLASEEMELYMSFQGGFKCFDLDIVAQKAWSILAYPIPWWVEGSTLFRGLFLICFLWGKSIFIRLSVCGERELLV